MSDDRKNGLAALEVIRQYVDGARKQSIPIDECLATIEEALVRDAEAQAALAAAASDLPLSPESALRVLYIEGSPAIRAKARQVIGELIDRDEAATRSVPSLSMGKKHEYGLGLRLWRRHDLRHVVDDPTPGEDHSWDTADAIEAALVREAGIPALWRRITKERANGFSRARELAAAVAESGYDDGVMCVQTAEHREMGRRIRAIVDPEPEPR